MKRIAYAFAATLIIGGPAIAAEEKAKTCHPLDEMKAQTPGGKFSTLNVGQFHLLEGAYIVLPPLSGLPKADGAVLVQAKGWKGALVVWTRGSNPTCLADAEPMPITSDKMLAILRSINPGQGEKIDAIDPDDDLRL